MKGMIYSINNNARKIFNLCQCLAGLKFILCAYRKRFHLIQQLTTFLSLSIFFFYNTDIFIYCMFLKIKKKRRISFGNKRVKKKNNIFDSHENFPIVFAASLRNYLFIISFLFSHTFIYSQKNMRNLCLSLFLILKFFYFITIFHFTYL